MYRVGRSTAGASVDFSHSPTSGASRVLLLGERLVDLLCNDTITRVYKTVESVLTYFFKSYVCFINLYDR